MGGSHVLKAEILKTVFAPISYTVHFTTKNVFIYYPAFNEHIRSLLLVSVLFLSNMLSIGINL